jgi:tetratricopeptide (TPR) repeat protein
MAKLLESSWRGKARAELTPQEAYLLDRAAKEMRLIPFRRFHPSVALLPNQEDAALAYAQVLSFLVYVDERLADRPWAREILEGVGGGEAVDEAFTRVSRFNVRRLYLWWEQTVAGRRLTPVPAVGLMKRRYQRGATGADQVEESLLSAEAKRLVRLGDLLRLRGHVAAAEQEYRRALVAAGADPPEITDRLGGVLLEQEKWGQVVEALEPASRLYPSHATVHVQLGLALASLARDREAAAALENAAAVNPFQPKIHCALADIYAKLGSADRARLESANCSAFAVPAGGAGIQAEGSGN